MIFSKKIKPYCGHPIAWRKKHDGYGMDASLDMILDLLGETGLNFGVALSKSDKTIKLNIPHGDLYHHCSDSEWEKILNLLGVM